jgi:hypothetical protein
MEHESSLLTSQMAATGSRPNSTSMHFIPRPSHNMQERNRYKDGRIS